MNLLKNYRDLEGRTIKRVVVYAEPQVGEWVALWCSDGSVLVMGHEFDYDHVEPWEVRAPCISTVVAALGFPQQVSDNA
jgi:hypothetical protein